jgi:Fic family protein
MAAAALSKRSTLALERLEKFFIDQHGYILPEGSFTRAEYSKRLKCNEDTAFYRLAKLVENGSLTKQVVPMADEQGKHRLTAVYTPVEKI